MGQQITAPSFDLQNDIPGFNGLAILLANPDLQIVAHQQPAKLGDSGNHTGFFSLNLGTCMLIHYAYVLIR